MNERLREIFSNCLKTRLIFQKKTHQNLADEIGVSLRTIDNWCSGKSVPSIEDLVAIAESTNTEIPEFFGIINVNISNDQHSPFKDIFNDRDSWREQAMFLKTLMQQKDEEITRLKSEIDQLKRAQGIV